MTVGLQALCLICLGQRYSGVGSFEETVNSLREAQELYRLLGQIDQVEALNHLVAWALLRKANAEYDVWERQELLNEALELFMRAAVQLDRQRFRVKNQGDRLGWYRHLAEDTMDEALQVAARLGRPAIIADAIATWRMVGTLDVDHLADAGETTIEMAPLGEVVGRVDDSDEVDALVTALPVGECVGFGVDIPRLMGPKLVMPSVRVALAKYLAPLDARPSIRYR